LGFRVSGFGFWVLGFGFRYSGFWFRGLLFKFADVFGGGGVGPDYDDPSVEVSFALHPVLPCGTFVKRKVDVRLPGKGDSNCH